MRIVRNADAIHDQRADGIVATYYLFPEYHFVYAENPPGIRQPWHRHDRVHETFYVLDGELELEWKDADGNARTETVRAGDLVEAEADLHSFLNRTDKTVRYIVIKQVLTGEDKADLLQHDKQTE